MRSAVTFGAAVILWLSPVSLFSGETLYNGIELPDVWPPVIRELSPPEKTDPLPPPYLHNPPALIPIDVGRQLFVDDFLIDSCTLKRTFYKLEPYAGNPILKPDQPYEAEGNWKEFRGPYAMPFSDGVWYDPKDQCFKMWYMGGLMHSTCYATSKDGLIWERPTLDVVPGTNIVFRSSRDSNTIWIDLNDSDPERRYKMFRFEKQPKWGLALHFSADGIHWSNEIRRAGFAYDRTTAFYNPFRKVWCFSIKGFYPKNETPGAFRVRRYWETADLMNSPMWTDETSSLLWFNTDRLDPPLEGSNGRSAYCYNLDAVAYESLMLGLFSIQQREGDKEKGQPKKNEVFLGFSRDGFYWDRPLREPFIPISEARGAWNWGNVQSAGGGCLVVGDKLYFYYSGRAGSGRLSKEKSFWDADGATGVGILRRDGFASMDAADKEGTLTTRPVSFRGRHLFVNADVAGTLQVEMLDAQGNPLKGFGRAECSPVRGDNTSQPIVWKSDKSLSALAGEPIRLRFYLTDGKLYSFWVSTEENGASGGYVAAGGPGFTGMTDTIGNDSSTKDGRE